MSEELDDELDSAGAVAGAVVPADIALDDIDVLGRRPCTFSMAESKSPP